MNPETSPPNKSQPNINPSNPKAAFSEPTSTETLPNHNVEFRFDQTKSFSVLTPKIPKVVVFALVGAFILGLVLIAWFIVTRQLLQPNSRTTSAPSDDPLLEPNPTLANTNLQTFYHPRLGVSFNYPSQIEICESNDAILINKHGEQACERFRQTITLQSLPEIIANYQTPPQTTTINGNQIYSLLWTDPDTSTQHHLAVIDNGQTQVVLDINSDDQDDLILFDEILSTITIQDPVSDPPDVPNQDSATPTPASLAPLTLTPILTIIPTLTPSVNSTPTQFPSPTPTIPDSERTGYLPPNLPPDVDYIEYW